METFNELIYYYSQNAGYVWEQFYRHFLMAAYGVLFAAIVGIPLGILIARHRKLSPWVMSIANIIQTIPALSHVSGSDACDGSWNEHRSLFLISLFTVTDY